MKKPIVESGGVTSAGAHFTTPIVNCPKEHQYRHVRGIATPQSQEPDALAIGLQVHAGRACWFANGFRSDATAWANVQDAMEKELESLKLPSSMEARRRAQQYMHEYITHWSLRPLPEVIACEYKLGPTALDPKDPDFMWRTARLDDVSKYPEVNGKLCIGECKTTSGSFNDCINEYTLNFQTLLQPALWARDPKGEALFGPAAGVMLDMIQKGYGKTKSQFQRHFLPTPKFAMKWFPQHLKHYLKQMTHVTWDAEVPRKFTHCTRQIGRKRVACEFRDLCMHGREASMKYVFKDTGKSLLSWKPEPGKETPPWE